MIDYQYFIVGGGMTADSAARGIRQVDPDGTIGMISREPYPPYNRPPLTKGLWKGKTIDQIWRGTDKFKVDLYLGHSVTSLDPVQKNVIDDQGTIYHYSRLLLATGGKPRRLPFGGNHVLYYRTLGDYKRLKSMSEISHRILVIGGGFIGTELAAALNIAGNEVVMGFPEASIGQRIFPAGLSEYVTEYYRQRGVELFPGSRIEDIEPLGDRLNIKARGIGPIQAEGIVAGIGIIPNTDLAEAAGLDVDNGIVVNEFLQTKDPDIFAAGDVANFYNPALGVRMRVEHEDNANTMGMVAGENMAGAKLPYDHLPNFYSDLFDLGYEAVGELDTRLETVEDWQEKYQKGTVFYLREGRVRGVLLWNNWGKIEKARMILKKEGPADPQSLKSLISSP